MQVPREWLFEGKIFKFKRATSHINRFFANTRFQVTNRHSQFRFGDKISSSELELTLLKLFSLKKSEITQS